MNIQTRKLQFIEAFLKLQSEDIISLFENLLKSEAKTNFKTFSIETLNERINTSEHDFETGNFKTQQEVFEKYK